jgi:hypothetical protein
MDEVEIDGEEIVGDGIERQVGIERIAVTYCMASCETDSDCRSDDGYECVTQDSFANMEATVLDGDGKEFCSIPLLIMSELPEADASVPDMSQPDASSEDDAGR